MAFEPGYAGGSFEVFSDWRAAAEAPGSSFFRGRLGGSEVDSGPGVRLSEELLFTQSNARVLIGQATGGNLRFLAMPTQVYGAPVMVHEHTPGGIAFSPGMYHQADLVMYLGDLSYRLVLDGSEAEVDPVVEGSGNETRYAAHFLPATSAKYGDLDVDIMSFAPVAEDANVAPLAPAPLPGPAGAFYVMRLKNRGSKPVRGSVRLLASNNLVGHRSEVEAPSALGGRVESEVRQQTLILSRPFGSVGIHLHNGVWSKSGEGFQAERPIYIKPGDEICVETRLVSGRKYDDVMREIFRLYLLSGLEWLDRTALFWKGRLGNLEVDAQDAQREAQMSRDLHLRFLLDNFNCLQTDGEGNLVSHWQGAPSHQWAAKK